ncbi:MAG: molybdopterin-dependent oxidoreductase, partial [Gammaproteobacteria bacterium]|nr:molybdopterin-dependent oxidoreductase [Gammaproteobacteria bacterium]
LTLRTRRPVRLEFTRTEEFTSSRSRHAQTLHFRTGVDSDGWIVANELRVVANTG